MMSDTVTAAQISDFLEDEGNVEALTNALQSLHHIFLDGTSDRPPRGIFPIETILTMSQEAHHRRQHNQNPFCYSRLDILDAHICAMHAGWQIGIDLAEGRDFTPTED